MTDKIKVVKKNIKADTTDKSLSVQNFSEYESINKWDKNNIIDALKVEANIETKLAEEIADNVEKKMIKLDVERVTTDFVRSLVDEELVMRGLNKKLLKQKMLGVSTFDLEQVMFSKTKENANVQANTPEAVNMYIAEATLKQYALNRVFSQSVSDAHMEAKIHLHDLGFITRLYCSSHSLELIKKYGLSLVNLSTESKPANHAHTLTGHLNTFLSSMQTYYAGALGLAYLNVFYSPLLIELTDEEIKHEAQYLIFSLSQNAFSRGSQSLFIDANIDFAVPTFLKDVACIVKNGMYCTEFDIKDKNLKDGHNKADFRKCFWVYTKEAKKATKKDLIAHLENIGRTKILGMVQESEVTSKLLTFGDFEEQTQTFAKALMEVWLAGDKTGKIFPFPKFQAHINEHTFKDPKQMELYNFSCKLASEKGITNFVFDRDSISLSQCCRLKETVTDMTMISSPETLRFTGFQNVSMNLPQAAYRANGDFDKTVKEIKSCMDIAMMAHLQKKRYIATLMESQELPLWQVGKTWPDGRPYVDLEKATYIIGIVGLNECIQHITGKQLHETEEAYKMGIKIIASMWQYTKVLAKEHGLKVVLEESPAESTSPRFAKIDIKTFPESKKYIKGNQKTGDVYYTNSIHYAADAPIDIIQRIEGQSKFAQLIEAGSITHVFLGDQNISSETIANLVEKTFKNTNCAQLTISPELVFCSDCGHIHKGFNDIFDEINE